MVGHFFKKKLFLIIRNKTHNIQMEICDAATTFFSRGNAIWMLKMRKAWFREKSFHSRLLVTGPF